LTTQKQNKETDENEKNSNMYEKNSMTTMLVGTSMNALTDATRLHMLCMYSCAPKFKFISVPPDGATIQYEISNPGFCDFSEQRV